MRSRQRLVRCVVVAWAAIGLIAAGGSRSEAAAIATRTARPQRTLPAEFERQDAVLLGWDSDNVLVQRALIDIIGAAWDRAQIVMLVKKADDQLAVESALQIAGLPPEAVQFLPVPFNTIWARDYGPTVVRMGDGQLQLVDADYERGQRPEDDDVPCNLAPQLSLPAVHTPLAIEGGNLLSNGAGLCVTSGKLLEQNAKRGYTERDVTHLLSETFGARDVLYLEPLFGEPTGHVDMFCTFTGIDTVLVAQLPPEVDPVNSDLLDRNAERLAQIMTPRGPMRVIRIPMPPRDEHLWRTYTNVLYANGVVLVPVYPGVDHQGEQEALAAYRRLLPGWKIIGIDCTHLITLGGAVHCVSKNLSEIGRITPVPAPRRHDNGGWDVAVTDSPAMTIFPEEATPGGSDGDVPDDGWQPVDHPAADHGVHSGEDDSWDRPVIEPRPAFVAPRLRARYEPMFVPDTVHGPRNVRYPFTRD